MRERDTERERERERERGGGEREREGGGGWIGEKGRGASYVFILQRYIHLGDVGGEGEGEG